MSYLKRTLKTVVEIDGKPTTFVVNPDGETFQCYQKYLVCDNYGRNVHRYQTDATTKNEILDYLNRVLPTLFHKGTLKNSPYNWCSF